MNLYGSGLSSLMLPNDLPSVPVLVLGLAGSGRRTWVEAILTERNAQAVVRHDGHVKAEQARELTELARTPTRKPIWVSLNLTDQSTIAQNILLKTLEESPAHMKFFLRSTTSAALPTVLSRCATYHHSVSVDEQINAMLEAGVEFDSAQAAAAARPGSIGRALALAKTEDQADRAKTLLLAAYSRSLEEISAALAVGWASDCIAWLQVWVEDAILGNHTMVPQLAAECGTDILLQASKYLGSVHNSKLAARAAMTVLAERPR